MMKEFNWYLTLPLSIMKNSNMLPVYQLDNDVRLGLYYLMSVYGLGYHHCTRGSWEWICLSKGEDGEYLNREKILELEPDVEVYNRLKDEFDRGILPEGYVKAQEDIEEKNPQVKEFEYKEKFGWLSPTGEFTPGDWGHHETEAEKIIKDKGFYSEYEDWLMNETIGEARDYLSSVKGYVLIHNPSLDGGYVVTHTKPLTKKQREFLYDYFVAIGNIMRASSYLEED